MPKVPSRWLKLIEKLLPHTGDLQVDDAARALLRKDPDKYAEYLNALEKEFGHPAKRAQDQKYMDRDWYHGTTMPIEKFDDGAKGASTGAQSAKQGFFFAQEPSVASDYADLAHQKDIIREGDRVAPRKALINERKASLTPEQLQDKKLDLYNANERLKSWTRRKNYTTDPEEAAMAQQKIDELKKFIDETDKDVGFLDPNTTKKADLLVKVSEGEEHARNTRNQMRALKKQGLENSPEYAQLEAQLKPHYDAINALNDLEDSGGQNVLPVLLREGDTPFHVKDYKGQGYRDTSYANEMKQAAEDGKSGVLFKNTHDYAVMSNNPQQDIATVFEPNQIRSKFAAFDPRFKKSSDILAGTAGAAILGGAALSGEDSEAAGIQTIMKKLGVGMEEALRIKKLAPEIIPHGLQDENIRAIQDVTGMFKNPDKYAKLGQGADYSAHLSRSGRVVKKPIFRERSGTEKEIEDIVSPALMDSIGMGVNTKTVRLGDKPWQVQDVATPLDKITKNTSRHGGDRKMERLYKAWDAADLNTKSTDEDVAKAYKAIEDYKAELYKRQGIDPATLQEHYNALDKQGQARLAYPDEGSGIQTGSDIPNDIEKAFRLMFEQRAESKLGKVINPFDLHEGNIGLDRNRKPVAFDTSRFNKFDAGNATPEMKKKILESFIAKPEQRAELDAALAGGYMTKDGGIIRPIGTSEMPSTGWETAGVAGAGALGALAGSNDAEASPMDSSVFKKLAKLVGSKTDDGVRMSEKAKTLNERLIGMNDNGQWYKPSGKNVQGWAPEEAQMTLETLPIEVQNAIADAAKGDNQVMDAIYSKYFDYGSKPNELSKLLPEKIPDYTHGPNSYQDMLKARLKRGAPAVAGAVGAGLGGVSYLPEAEASPKLENPVDYYNKFNNLRKQLVGKTADAITDQTVPPEMREKARQYNEPTKTGLDMATDPLNAVDGPMGFLAPFMLDSEEEP